jgi:thiamine biosynthesis lipoprotein
MSNKKERPQVLSRRQVLRIVAVGGAAGLAWKLGLPGGNRSESISVTRQIMGTTLHLTVAGDDRESAQAAVDATLERMLALEARLSRFRDDSEVGMLNRDGSIADAGDDLIAVLRLGRELSEKGDGAFDVTVQPLLSLYRDHLARHQSLPDKAAIEARLFLVDYRALRVTGRRVSFDRPGMALTLDGIGKGYIIDRGVETLKAHGFPNVLVEAGGDLVASGTKAGQKPWRIGIRRPRPGMRSMLRIDATDRAVATSGDYLQPFTPDRATHHILDPRTGRSAPELASCTVVAPDAALADGLATLTMVLGSARSRELIESMPHCEGCFIAKDLTVTRTSGFRTL